MLFQGQPAEQGWDVSQGGHPSAATEIAVFIVYVLLAGAIGIGISRALKYAARKLRQNSPKPRPPA